MGLYCAVRVQVLQQYLRRCMLQSLHWGLSPGPSVYKTDALPLSYRGASKQATAALVLRWDTAGYDGHAGHSPLWHIVDQRHQGNCGNQGTHVAHGVPCGSLRHLIHKPHHHSQRRAGSPVHWGPASCCHPPIPQQATRVCLFLARGRRGHEASRDPLQRTSHAASTGD